MTTTPASPFLVSHSADFFDDDGNPRFRDLGLSVLEESGRIRQSVFAEHREEIGRDQVGDANGLIVLTPQVAPATLADTPELLAVGRFGVGYDNVDVQACTDADVLLYITAGAVDYSVAEATIGWMIALGHHLRIKDRLVRTGDWDARSGFMGCELRDRTIGLVGFGGIGRAVARMLAPFGVERILVFDPYVDADAAKAVGVESVSLDGLLRAADWVSIHCPLTEQTQNLISEKEIGLMKRTAFLLNTARGGIIDEDALYRALSEERIAGAALDCFAEEPVVEPHRFREFENVILAPHSIAWTNELFRDIGRAVCQGMVDLANGAVPRGVVNRDVLDSPGFRKKWKRIIGREPESAR